MTKTDVGNRNFAAKVGTVAKELWQRRSNEGYSKIKAT
jgi:hypothetical protein